MTGELTATINALITASEAVSRLLDEAAHALLIGDREECARLLARARVQIPGIEQIAKSGGGQNELDALERARQEWDAGEASDDQVLKYDALENMSDVCLSVRNGLAGIRAEKMR